MRFRFRSLLYVFLILWVQAAFADDNFCGTDDEPALIYSRVPISSVGNLRDYLDTNGYSRVGSLQDILSLTPSVGAATGANLDQIASYLASLNDFHSSMMKSSSEQIGQLISERLAGEIDSLFYTNQTTNRRISFNSAEEQFFNGNGYTANGTYAYVADDTISISLKITRLRDAETRTFVAVGEPITAVRQLAFRVFDAFQFPSNQSVFNPFHDKTWISLGGDSAGTAMRMSDALEYCEALNARLPTKMEVLLASKLGQYVSGIKINPRAPYTVTDSGVLKALIPATGSCNTVGNEVSRQYLVACIQD